MSSNGDLDKSHRDHPTREFPEYSPGRAALEQSGRTDEDGPDRADDLPPAEPTAGEPTPVDGAPRRSGCGLLVLVGVIGVALVTVLGLQGAGLWPQLRNPFTQEQADRSQPPLLKSIQDLSRYVAAEGNFQVVVDLQKNRKYVPEFLLNERTLFVGAGSVEAYVDFAKISEGAVVESADHKSAEIKLPAPQLGKTNLDLKNSYVFAENKGILNALGDAFGNDPNRQREVYQLAEDKITAAARDSGLAQRAQDNTRKMLEGLLRSLGYEKVTVSYTTP
ncbi:DUF4230 domain-containing protein [Micromonospora zhanjiangensis]|uniref:DUF4230 domain-containing protein n=1 Tax=Micromonospora zhanjiangensis TaxID=1522057 RepID=A0ABV8KNL4_9ACTN